MMKLYIHSHNYSITASQKILKKLQDHFPFWSRAENLKLYFFY